MKSHTCNVTASLRSDQSPIHRLLRSTPRSETWHPLAGDCVPTKRLILFSTAFNLNVFETKIVFCINWSIELATFFKCLYFQLAKTEFLLAFCKFASMSFEPWNIQVFPLVLMHRYALLCRTIVNVVYGRLYSESEGHSY